MKNIAVIGIFKPDYVGSEPGNSHAELTYMFYFQDLLRWSVYLYIEHKIAKFIFHT